MILLSRKAVYLKRKQDFIIINVNGIIFFIRLNNFQIGDDIIVGMGYA